MIKRYKELTEDQKARGIIFSSELCYGGKYVGGGTVHEVTATQKDRDRKIRLLLDDSFFDNSPWKYNLIRK